MTKLFFRIAKHRIQIRYFVENKIKKQKISNGKMKINWKQIIQKQIFYSNIYKVNTKTS